MTDWGITYSIVGLQVCVNLPNPEEFDKFNLKYDNGTRTLF